MKREGDSLLVFFTFTLHLHLVSEANLERATGLEPATYSLGSCRSTN